MNRILYKRVRFTLTLVIGTSCLTTSTFHQLCDCLWCRWSWCHHWWEESIDQVPAKIQKGQYFRYGNNAIVPNYRLTICSGNCRYKCSFSWRKVFSVCLFPFEEPPSCICNSCSFCLRKIQPTNISFKSSNRSFRRTFCRPKLYERCVTILSSNFPNSFQHVIFPLPANLQVMSAPVNAWKPGSAAALGWPKALYIGPVWISLIAVTMQVSDGRFGKRLTARSKTAVNLQ